MAKVLAPELIVVLSVSLVCMSGAHAQAPVANEPASVWSSRTGMLDHPVEFPPAQPDNEVGANELRKPAWQTTGQPSERILMCDPAR